MPRISPAHGIWRWAAVPALAVAVAIGTPPAAHASTRLAVPCDQGQARGNPNCDPGPPGTDTPELGSGELLLTGLLPIGGLLLYRRRAHKPQ